MFFHASFSSSTFFADEICAEGSIYIYEIHLSRFDPRAIHS